MLRKFTTVAALVGATLAIASPAAFAAGTGGIDPRVTNPVIPPTATHTTPAGVYPNLAAAKSACKAGISQHRWKSCVYQILSNGQDFLWVAV
jgi:hypothetical protein